MDNTKKSPTVLSLCAGYGGLEIGLRRAIGQINVVAHVEIEAFAIANLVNKMETGRMVPVPIWTDVKTLPCEVFRGRIDILTGGYPCQPFSTEGKREGDKDPRYLWPFIREHIRTIKPGWVFLENVEGHLSKGIVQVLADLEKMAYRVECGVFSAAEVGAPHQRKRVFILAYCKYINVQGKWPNNNQEGWEEQNGSLGLRGRTSWPARPGEPQCEWEEPRVVADTNIRRKQQWESSRMGWDREQNQTDKRGISKTKPQLGRTINGPTDRVDRLRLLGNGVVPATAEKAFITLYNKLIVKQR